MAFFVGGEGDRKNTTVAFNVRFFILTVNSLNEARFKYK